MALTAVNVSVGVSLGEGRYELAHVANSLPTKSTTTLSTDNAATLTAINAMGALTGYSALTGAAAALAAAQAAKATVDTDIAALTLTLTSDVCVVWNQSTVTNKNQLRAALRSILKQVDGGLGGLT